MIPARTRINITPSWIAGGPRFGIPFDLTKGLTLGNLWMAKINYEIAKLSGGDFELQWQDKHAWNQSPFYQETFVEHGRTQCLYAEDQMRAFGVIPDKVSYETDTFDLTWKVWNRMPFSKYMGGQNYMIGIFPCKMLSTIAMNTTVMHPWWITSMVVADMMSGRNCAVHGMDCVEGHSAYYLIAKHVQQACSKKGTPFFPEAPVTKLVSAPLLFKEDGTKIAGSDPVATNRFLVKNMIDAGLEPDRLWDFMENKCFKGGLRYENLVMMEAQQEIFMRSFNPDVIITNEEWDALLDGKI